MPPVSAKERRRAAQQKDQENKNSNMRKEGHREAAVSPFAFCRRTAECQAEKRTELRFGARGCRG